MDALAKILIVRFSSLGDIILATPLVRALRKRFPNAQIDFLLKAEYVDVLKYNPHLSTLIQFRTGGRDELRALRQKIRLERYDAIVDLHNSLRSRYVRMFSGARHIRIVNKRTIKRFLLVNLKRNFYNGIVPVAQRYLETVESFGVRDDDEGLEISVPEDTAMTVRALMERSKLQFFGAVIGLAPEARHPTKRWPPERFVELGVRCARSLQAKLLLLGGKDEREYCGDIAQMINTQASATVAESLAGKLSLLELAAATGYCDVVVSNDTGIMHLAAAQKRKVVAIFGPTVQEFGFAPFGTEHVVVERRDLGCRPCTHVGRDRCPMGHFRCMKDISMEDVFSGIRQLNVPESDSCSR